MSGYRDHHAEKAIKDLEFQVFDREAYVQRKTRSLKNAEYQMNRTLLDRLKFSVPTFLIATAVCIFGITLMVNNVEVDGFDGLDTFLSIAGCLVALFAVASIEEAIASHRGWAADAFEYAESELVRATEDFEKFTARLENAVADEERRKREYISPVDLLDIVISGSNADPAHRREEEALWEKIRESPDSKSAWATLAQHNGWPKSVAAQAQDSFARISGRNRVDLDIASSTFII